MLNYVLVFVNFIRNVRLSDQVFRIGLKKTARQVEAILEKDHPFAWVVIFIVLIIISLLSSLLTFAFPLIHQFTCQAEIGQFAIGQFNYPITFKVVV